MVRPTFSSDVPLAAGMRIGGARYILKRLLGSGEISEVWLAQDAKGGRFVALKFLPQILLADKNVIERLKEETGRNILLGHPHVVSTWEFVEDHHAAAIAMEYISGWSLAALKVDRPQQCYRVQEIEWWVRQLCVAVDYAHTEFGILHRDLKPANLLLSRHDELKITDFGIAHSIRNETSRRGGIQRVYGGISFLSPQQVMGEEPSRLDDVYALGATIFDLLTGTPPFYKGEIVAQVCSLNPPTMTERLRERGIVDGSIPEIWEKTVATCLAKKPSDRPQSVVEIQQMLDRFELPEIIPAPPELTTAKTDHQTTLPAEPTVDDETAVVAMPADKPVAMDTVPAQRRPLVPVVLTAALVIALLMAGLFAVSKIKRGSANTASGIADSTFNVGTGADDDVYAIAIQPDGKILVGGMFSSFNGVPRQRVARLNADGSLDPGFAPQIPGPVQAIALQSDGRILVGGGAMQAGRGRRRVVRLNVDGTLEESFGAQMGYNTEVRTLMVQHDDKVLVGGSFTRAAGSSQNRIVRLKSNGERDEAFFLDGASGVVWAIALQPDGRILVGGEFTSFNGKPAERITRLNPDGSVDAAFKIGTGAHGDVFAIAIQKDGKILLGGDFVSFNGNPCQHIVRLNPDGSVDSKFTASPNAEVRCLVIQPDDRLLIAGDFTEVQGTPRDCIARLNPDGSLDKRFNPGEGAADKVRSMRVQADGRILLGGSFKTFNGAPSGGLVRLQ